MTPEENIRIKDLQNPELNSAQLIAMEQAERSPVSLSVNTVLRSAQEQTNLNDFGSDDFIPRLEQYLEFVDTDTNHTAWFRSQTLQECIQWAKVRLQVQDLLCRHPEINEVEIKEPLVIIGPPRSGTTHMHGLIGADTRIRSLRMWEVREPVPSKNGNHGKDPRLFRYENNLRQEDLLAGHLSSMNPQIGSDHVVEEILLQRPDFPSWLWLGTCVQGQKPHYDYMKTILKILQWQRGPERWVLKSPYYCENIGTLLETFPDATFAITHRDPIAIVQSAAVMNAYAARLKYYRIDIGKIFRDCERSIKNKLQAIVRDRKKLPDYSSIDIRFCEFINHQIATIEQIYEVANLHLESRQRINMETFITEQRQRSKRFEYNLKDDFDIDVKRLRGKFSFYETWFPVEHEVR